ncbi:hypothetical protein ACFO25_11130 [Paenactinomyces guangxiensis]|uniref:Uncharacterized protein n=1 Tax=Paenactinomyces guangxiensis TaxID=1490290 RepID=A0A7W1WQG6_9BACL|nr:hypothetical protein [Paenactinomyces guangxiensis]MBA4494053.1 hypothetical protein [Paenactinomyces guangxiensis]MBH8591202.1 hypothetical protein [Paenactinomyces guangxiensis]
MRYTRVVEEADEVPMWELQVRNRELFQKYSPKRTVSKNKHSSPRRMKSAFAIG